LPGRGLDCVGLVAYCSNTLGLSEREFDNTNYSHFPAQHIVQYQLGEYLDRVPFDGARAGDVALIADDGNHSCHVGILALDGRGNLTLIHAAARARAVVESRIDSAMRRQMRAVFRFRGLVDEA